MSSRVRVAVDIGGTFTDLVLDTGTDVRTRKVLTTPRAPEQAVVNGLDILLREAGLEASAVDLFVHGTTLATNAIIERKGARTALVTTEGFRDVLDIADEGRFDQYDIFIEKPKHLVPRALRFTVPERVSAAGEVLLALDEDAVAALAPKLRESGAESIAIAFIHAYAAGEHERRAREILEAALPGVAIAISSEVCPEIREYERTSTTVANAYVQPLMDGYLGRLEEALKARGMKAPLYLMTSGGGLTTVGTARRFPIRLVESGPAGGAMLASQIAAELGEDRLLSFDMGGTTAKICLIQDRKPQTARTFEVDRQARFMKGSGFPVRIPVIEMVEIGAGGGSIGRVDSLGRITVGPDSAGSEPGPACYGRGGEDAAVTDADVVLGRLTPEGFAGGQMTLDVAASRAAVGRSVGEPLGMDETTAAFGISEIIDENMANAARVHAVESGVNVADYAMVAFGGAAPLHAARLAEKLGIRRLVVPCNAGVGSAVGFLASPVGYEVVRSLHLTLGSFDAARANALLDEMHAEAHEVVREGARDARLEQKRLIYMRYVGQGHEVAVAIPTRELEPADGATLRAAFEEAYRALFGRVIPDAEVETLTWALTLATSVPAPATAPEASRREAGAPRLRREVFEPGARAFVELPVFAREAMPPGTAVAGPCLIEEQTTTTFVTASFDARIDGAGHLVLERKD
ncbi:hydantoinase/oxoprolinase family protein [Geminicoccaceae bacterium 1502E]|nr:hydantoinase/oxoprolinase family protein [Geminicoccaceae bacterium 1502E]